jgi:DNA-binding transcriptional ArsR family regulator
MIAMARRLFILNDAPYGTERATTASGSRAPCLDLLVLLSEGARAVEALAHQTGQSVATRSHHLLVLRRARLVEAYKAGLYLTCRLADPEVGEFLQLRSLAESRLAEVQHVTRQYLEERGALECPRRRSHACRRPAA